MALEHKGEFHVEHGFGLPRKTTAERIAYEPSDVGYQVYDTTEDKVYVCTDATTGTVVWEVLTTGGDASGKVSISGDTMTGALVLSGNPATALEAATKQYVDAVDSKVDARVAKAGDTMAGDLAMDSNEVTGLPATPSSATAATSKAYVDGLATNYATAAQGTLAGTAVQPADSVGTLVDVDLTTPPNDGQALVWNNTNSAFEPTDVSIDTSGFVDLTTEQTIASTKIFETDATDFDFIRFNKTDGTTSTELAALGVSTFGSPSLELTAGSTTRATFRDDSIFLTADSSSIEIEEGQIELYFGNVTNGFFQTSNGAGDSILLDDGRFRANTSDSSTLELFSDGTNPATFTGKLTNVDFLVVTHTPSVPATDVAVFGKKVQSPTTVSGDIDATLTTKGYVDGEIAILSDGLVSGINDLSDVDITSTADGDFLRHNGTAWVDAALVAADIPDLTATYATAAQGTTADSAVQPTDSVGVLSDVDLTAPATNNQVLAWNGSAFAPSTLADGVTTLDGLTDVDTSTTPPVSGDALFHDGTNFVNRALVLADVSDFVATNYATGAEGDLASSALQNITSESIGDLSDVDTTTIPPSNGQVLGFDGTSFVPVTPAATDLTNYVTLDSAQTITGAKTFTDDFIVNTTRTPSAFSIIEDPTDELDSATVLRHQGDHQSISNLSYENVFTFQADRTIMRVDRSASTSTSYSQLDMKPSSLRYRAEILSPANIIGTLDSSTSELRYSVINNPAGKSSYFSFAENDTTYQFVVNFDQVDIIKYSHTTGNQIDFGVKATSPATVSADDADVLTTKGYVDAEIAAATPTVSVATNDLTDVTITSQTTGHVLVADSGTSFVNRALTASDVSGVATAAQGALADSAVQPGDATSMLTNNNAFVDLTTAQTIAGAKTFSDAIQANGSVTIAGDLTVTGTTTSVNSTNTDITDSIITLNKGENGAGVTSPNQAGLQIDRGNENDVFLIWSEAADKFGFAEDTGTQEGAVDVTTFKAFAFAEDVTASKYQATFNTGDWTAGTPNTFVVTAATHGLPYTAGDIFDVTVFEGTEKVSIETSINATTGDVTLKTTGAVFAGTIKISV